MFEFLKKLFRKKNSAPEWEIDDEISPSLDRSKMDLKDPEQMDRYVVGCCEQMRESTEAIDMISREYALVTDDLTDMEEIEMLPPQEREPINACAQRIKELFIDKTAFQNRVGAMSDEEYYAMARFEHDMPDALEKLRKDEEYRKVVKQDLQSLEGEKMTYRFQRLEMQERQHLCRDMTVILVFSMLCVTIVLLVLQLKLELDVKIGYILTAGFSAVGLTALFLVFENAGRQVRNASRHLNRAISVQNTVKIRYVNASSVIEYAYVRFGIHHSEELAHKWEKFVVEKQRREAFLNTDFELTDQQEQLLVLLRKNRIKTPELWLSQPEALLDPREMVEIRHGLILRRQSLRKQIEYNEESRQSAKREVTGLVKQYPGSAQRILDIVASYD